MRPPLLPTLVLVVKFLDASEMPFVKVLRVGISTRFSVQQPDVEEAASSSSTAVPYPRELQDSLVECQEEDQQGHHLGTTWLSTLTQ